METSESRNGASETVGRVTPSRLRLSPVVNDLSGQLVDAAFQVHKALGPGLLESVYESCFAAELQHRGIKFDRQVGVDIRYRDVEIESGLRLDFLVEGIMIVEMKATIDANPVYFAQVASYLRLTNLPLGLLMNFNVPRIRDGIDRVINPAYVGPLRLN
jgi:iron complex transport system substrate-binding protein